MTINEGDLVLFLWVATPPRLALPPGFQHADWLGILVARKGGPLEVEYRFRYHAGPGFEAGDKISRTGFTHDDSPGSRERCAAAIRNMLRKAGFENIHEVAVNGDGGALQEALLAMPGWQVSVRRMDNA